MHVRLSKPMTQIPSSRECDMPVHHLSLTVQADTIDWIVDHIKDGLEDKVRPQVVTFVANLKPNFDKLVEQVKQAAP